MNKILARGGLVENNFRKLFSVIIHPLGVIDN